jgi:zinc transport system substrate-binding protein
MKKIIFIVGIITLVALGIYGVLNLSQKTTKESEKITVVSTLFPMHDFAKIIGGDKVEASLLLSPGVEAHTFEPKPSDIAKISKADIFVYTGEFMEPWAHDIIAGVKGNKVKVVDASTGIELMKEDEEHEHEHKHEDEHHGEEADHHEEDEHGHHHHGGVDPHIWLDFDNAKTMAGSIAKALAEVDPANATYYQDNAKKLSENLTHLDNSYKKTLLNCQSKQIVYGGHYAFGYMAKRYGLEYMAAQGFSPDSEPTAKDMIALVEQIKKNNIKYVFYEELSSPKIAETLAKETGTQMLLLNGAHNLAKEDYENNATYISFMESNLQNLSLGLNCQK